MKKRTIILSLVAFIVTAGNAFTTKISNRLSGGNAWYLTFAGVVCTKDPTCKWVVISSGNDPCNLEPSFDGKFYKTSHCIVPCNSTTHVQ